MARRCGAILGLLFLAHAAAAQFIQQGSKLVGTGAVNPANQGLSVAISADGTTAVVGGPSDNSNVGAAWVFTRSGGVWSQQGAKLVANDSFGAAFDGVSVAIAADGNTAILGGPRDNNNVGAAWVFTRVGELWVQQGAKLAAGNGAVVQGISVAISGDGNTAIVGGFIVNSIAGTSAGAAWVYTRSGAVWKQQGRTLAGPSSTGAANLAISVAISGDGNTAIVGGFADVQGAALGGGAAWVYTRNGNAWTQQGSELVGTGAAGAAGQGESVAISGDGNTAVVGGYRDDSQAGAAWIFTRTGGVWSQQGDKLVGSGAVGAAKQGLRVTISGDGNTAILGGLDDNSGVGASWVFTRSGGVWSQQGGKLVGTGAVGAAGQGESVAISGDGTTVIVGGAGDDGDVGATWVFAAPSMEVWVPVASHAGGLDDSQWRSDLGLLNPGATAANVQIEFFGGGGVASDTVSVAAGAQSILTDVIGQLGGSGSGAIEILSDQPLKVAARTYNQVSSTAACDPSGTQGQDYPAVASGGGLSAGQSAYLAGLTENASHRSNIGVANTGTGSATVVVTLYDGSGTSLANYTVNLAAGQWAQATQPFLNRAGQTAMDSGYATVALLSGSGGVFAFASVIDNITNDPTTVAMQESAAAAVVWVPVASHASGLNSSQWRSDLGLLNAGTVTASVQIQFYGSGGVLRDPAPVSVAAGTQVILTDVVGQLGGSGSGALELTSDQPLIITSRSYNQVGANSSCYPNGTQGQDYPAVVAGNGLGAGQSAYLAGLTENASYRSNIGVVNTGTESAAVLLELFDGAGNVLAGYTVDLAAGEWAQTTQPFKNDASEIALDSGYATITVQAGSGVFAFASVIDNITNDPTTVTMLR